MITTTALGAAMERAARRLVPFLALAVVCLTLLAETAFTTGRLLRLALDDRAQQLAALHCRALGLTDTTATDAVTAVSDPVPVASEPPAPALTLPCAAASRRPAAGIAPDLSRLTVAQLRRLARSRGHHGASVRDARRSTLLAMLA